MKASKKIQRNLPPPVPGPAPWLVFPCGEDRKKQAFFDISNPKLNYVTSFQKMRGKECLLSMYGWLILRNTTSVKDYRGKNGKSNVKAECDYCSLWNPDTRETIDLPSWDSQDVVDGLGKCILTAPPVCPDCMILFIGRSYILSFQLGGEKWIKHYYTLEDDDVTLDDFIDSVVTSTDGTLYALTFKNMFATVERNPCGTLSVRLLELDIEKPRLYPKTQCYRKYMVESCGEIYHVVVHLMRKNDKVVECVEIFKMDFSKEVWVEVVSLGERVFILSDYGCMSCSGTMSGMRGNQIYFTFPEDKKSLYVFCLEDESLSVYLPCPDLRKPFFSPFWLMPGKRVDNVSETGTGVEIMDKTNDAVTVINANVEESKGPHWIDLSIDALLLTLKQLPSAVDYRNFRSTCKTLASCVPPVLDPICSTTRCPWLMYSNRERSMCSFLDPISNLTHCFYMPELLGARICFSSFGWLLMAKGDQSMFFFNPFDMVTIKLPDLPTDFAFSGLSFSCSPTSSDCIVFGVSSLTCDLVDICYLRLGEEAWIWSQFKNYVKIILCNNNPVFFDGAFYCLSYERHLGVFDLEGGSWDWTVVRMAEPNKSVDQNYLVQCDGNLLSIYVGPKGKWVSIYELITRRNELKWSPVYDLGDQMVFVSRSTSISMKAVTEGMKNKIYFPITFGGKDNYVYYSLATRAWHSSFDKYPRSDIYYTQEQLHCTWIYPALLPENV